MKTETNKTTKTTANTNKTTNKMKQYAGSSNEEPLVHDEGGEERRGGGLGPKEIQNRKYGIPVQETEIPEGHHRCPKCVGRGKCDTKREEQITCTALNRSGYCNGPDKGEFTGQFIILCRMCGGEGGPCANPECVNGIHDFTPCKQCNGTGYESRVSTIIDTCPMCNGSKFVTHEVYEEWSIGQTTALMKKMNSRQLEKGEPARVVVSP